ncbi:MAG TPA: hypothetical protein VEG66_09065 [Thermoplasmata archaeon]|nr:hypothetical protein [Thermoplasmata archaeon]
MVEPSNLPEQARESTPWTPPLPAVPRPSRRLSRRRWFEVVGVVVLVVAASLTTVVVLVHTGCALGGEVGLFNVTAPQMVVNIPQNGSAGMFQNAMNWTVSSGSLTLGGLPTQEPTSGFGFTVTHGSGLNLLDRQPIFAVYSAHNATMLSTTARPCTQPYVAQAVGPGFCGGFAYAGWPIPYPANDSVEPHVLNVSCPAIPLKSGIKSGAYMWFDNAFPSPSGNGATPGVVSLDLCNWTTNFTHYAWGEVGIPFILHVPEPGPGISVHGYVNWESWLGGNLSSAKYVLPPGAMWRVAVIGEYSLSYAGILPPGLLAFQRLSC